MNKTLQHISKTLYENTVNLLTDIDDVENVQNTGSNITKKTINNKYDAITQQLIYAIENDRVTPDMVNIINDVNNYKKYKGLIVAESKSHLILLIDKGIKLFGTQCNLNWIDISKITSLSFIFKDYNFFYSTNNRHWFNGDISLWDTSNVTDMEEMFCNNKYFNGNISQWDVSNVTNMSGMFHDAKFNNDISQWDVHNVLDMTSMFQWSRFNQDISRWNINNKCDTHGMCSNIQLSHYKPVQLSYTDEEIANLNNTPMTIVQLAQLIKYNVRLHGWECNLNHIDVSNITNMSGLFAYPWPYSTDVRTYDLNAFNGDISQWDVSNVIDMSFMFHHSDFTGDISQWDVSNVADMSFMFYDSVWNGDISNWDVSNVINMEKMFNHSKFTGKYSINNWDVSNVMNMRYMFWSSQFDSDISNWKINKSCNTENMIGRISIDGQYKPSSLMNENINILSDIETDDIETDNYNISRKSVNSKMNIDDVLSIHNGFKYVDLGLPSGTLWAECNVGAATQYEYGDYFAWGETKTKNGFFWETYKYNVSVDDVNEFTKYSKNDKLNILELVDDAANKHMGGKWHMPTLDQVNELIHKTESRWVNNYKNTGVAGRVFVGVNGNKLFIPAAGLCQFKNNCNKQTHGYIWCSTLSPTPLNATYMYFDNRHHIYSHADWRFYGYSVRGVINANSLKENLNILSDIDTELNDIDDISAKSVNNKILDPRAKMTQELQNVIFNGADMDDELKNKLNNPKNFKMFRNLIYASSKSKLVYIIKSCIDKIGINGNYNWIDTSGVDDMSWIFSNDSNFGKSIGYFDGDISLWDMSNVKYANGMFCDSAFTGDVSKWDVSNLREAAYMFAYTPVDYDVSKWNVSNLVNGYRMLYYTKTSCDVSQWDISSLKKYKDMFTGTYIPRRCVDNWDIPDKHELFMASY